MSEEKFSVMELSFLAITRVALGAGIGLLLSKCLNEDQRRAAGVALIAVGAITTVPVIMHVLQQDNSIEEI